jgi:hypothetical protein
MRKKFLAVIVIGVILTTIYYIGGYDKPSPKTGEIIFDVPSIINKNIDEVMLELGKAPETYKDSLYSGDDLLRIDSNSEFRIRKYHEKILSGYFTYSKDGWVLGVDFDFNSRKIESIGIYANTEKGYRRKGFFDEKNLLLIGNLKISSKNYRVTFWDFMTMEYELSQGKIYKAYGMTAYPKY